MCANLQYKINLVAAVGDTRYHRTIIQGYPPQIASLYTLIFKPYPHIGLQAHVQRIDIQGDNVYTAHFSIADTPDRHVLFAEHQEWVKGDVILPV